MNCEEVKCCLSDYLDETLDKAMMTRIATHIISCSLCRAETNELADCLQQVATLPTIDPPLGFAQRVMAHVHEIEPKARLWDRLLAPLTRKIPLPATAVVIVAILAVFLYRKEETSKQNDSVNLAIQAAPPASTSEKKEAVVTGSFAPPLATLQPKQEANTVVPTALENAKPAADESLPKISTVMSSPRDQIQSAPPPVSKAEIEARLKDTKEAPKRPPIQVQEVSNAREPGRLSGDAIGFGVGIPLGALRQAAPRPAPASVERALSQLGERSADIEFVVRRRPPQRRDQVENISADSLGKPTETDSAPGSASRRAASAPKIESIAELRFYNVALEHYELFKKDLAAEAIVESESNFSAKEREAVAQADRALLIKVIILPPDAAAPSR